MYLESSGLSRAKLKVMGELLLGVLHHRLPFLVVCSKTTCIPQSDGGGGSSMHEKFRFRADSEG